MVMAAQAILIKAIAGFVPDLSQFVLSRVGQ